MAGMRSGHPVQGLFKAPRDALYPYEPCYSAASFAAHRYRAAAPPPPKGEEATEGTPLGLAAHGLRPRYPGYLAATSEGRRAR
jgi:hypothetical protein